MLTNPTVAERQDQWPLQNQSCHKDWAASLYGELGFFVGIANSYFPLSGAHAPLTLPANHSADHAERHHPQHLAHLPGDHLLLLLPDQPDFLQREVERIGAKVDAATLLEKFITNMQRERSEVSRKPNCCVVVF